MIQLGVNIDHIATIRNARGVNYPDPVVGAQVALQAGADFITLHLREDRRHIRDEDLARLRQHISGRINLECALADDMIQIALNAQTSDVCLVPERREELTTEGGLNLLNYEAKLSSVIKTFAANGTVVSLFIEPDEAMIDCAQRVGAPAIELHTGHYANLSVEAQPVALARLQHAARYADRLGLAVHAGHGLTQHNIRQVAQIKEITELNIGHAIIADAIFVGLDEAVRSFKRHLVLGRM